MIEKEKIDQIDESEEKTTSIEKWAKEDLVEELKYPSQKDIPSDYKSWEKSSLSKWSHRDVEYAYGEWKDDVIWTVLVDYSYYPGGWFWMEYWVKIFVKRWNETDMKRIVYRDSYDAYRDDWWKAYTSIDWIEVHWDRVTVKLSSSRRTDTYTFYLKKPDKPVQKKEWLSLEQQAKFKKFFESEKERLLGKETRQDWRYPASYDLTLRQIPNVFGSDGIHPYDERPYDKAQVVDQYIDVEWWTACIVIKTQIDANTDCGKQFQWLKYVITPKWSTLVDRDQAYQSEMRSGKKIDMHAS